MSDPIDPLANPRRDFAVGLTAVFALVVLGALITMIGAVPDFLEKSYKVTVELDQAPGLSAGSTVTFVGVPIGKVSEVSLLEGEDGRMRVRAVAEIKDEIDIPATARVEMREQLLGGLGKLVLISDQPSDSMLPRDGSAVIQGERVTQGTELARQVMEGFGGSFKQLVDDFHHLSKSLRMTSDYIAEMFEPRDAEAVRNGSETPNLAALVEELHSTVHGVNNWVNDPVTRQKVEGVLARADAVLISFEETSNLTRDEVQVLSKRLDQLMTSWDETAQVTTSAVGETRKEMKVALAEARQALTRLDEQTAEVAKQTRATIESYRSLAEQARQGKGTVGRLVQDPALYDNLDDAVQRVGVAADKLRLLIEKFNTEGVELQLK